MARGKAKDYEQEAAELREKRAKLAGQRREIADAMQRHARVVDEAPARRRAALVAEARGEAPAETIEQITLDAQRAAAEIVAAREKVSALEVVEREIGSEITALIDRHPEHHVRKAEAASEAAQQAIADASQAAQAAAQAWREASGAWSVVRLSRNRRGLDLSPEMGISDLGGAVNELSKATSRPWPGGSRGAWERWREREGVTATRPPASEPLIESV
jgi:hypothetical protein